MTKMNKKLHPAFELNVEIIMLLDKIAKKVMDADSDAENKSYHFQYCDKTYSTRCLCLIMFG